MARWSWCTGNWGRSLKTSIRIRKRIIRTEREKTYDGVKRIYQFREMKNRTEEEDRWSTNYVRQLLFIRDFFSQIVHIYKSTAHARSNVWKEEGWRGKTNWREKEKWMWDENERERERTKNESKEEKMKENNFLRMRRLLRESLTNFR